MPILQLRLYVGVLLTGILHIREQVSVRANGTDPPAIPTLPPISSQPFQSDEDPVFTGLYPLNARQTVFLSYARTFGVRFRHFELEDSPGCDKDYVVIQGKDLRSVGAQTHTLWGPVCGTQNRDSASFLNVLLIFRDFDQFLNLIFSSDRDVRAPGFSGDIYSRSHDRRPFDRVEACAHTINSVMDGWLRVNSDPFSRNHKSCNFRVTAPADHVLQFEMTPSGSTSCGWFAFYDVTGYDEVWLSTHYVNSSSGSDVILGNYDQVSVYWNPCNSPLLTDININYTAVPREIVEDLHCPDKYMLFEGNCYKLDTTFSAISWDYAESKCILDNGHLVSITSRREMRFLNRIINSHEQTHFVTMCEAYYQISGIFMGLKWQAESSTFNWTDGSPYVYSEWYGPERYGFDPYGVPKELIGVFNKEFIQPRAQDTLQCTLMMAFHPGPVGDGLSPHGKGRWGNWIRIPCYKPICCMSAVCKKPANKSMGGFHGGIVPKNNPTQEKGLLSSLVHQHYCPHKWVYINDRCFFLYTLNTFGILTISGNGVNEASSNSNNWFLAPNSSMTFRDATKKCASIHGNVASFPQDGSLEVAAIQKYFSLWDKEQRWVNDAAMLTESIYDSRQILFSDFLQPWIRIGNESCVRGLEPRPTLHGEQNLSHCLQDNSTLSLFSLCERDPLKETNNCSNHQFRCQDGTCISIMHLCDGMADCLNGEDEVECSCDFGSFSCSDGSCISVSKVCDHRKDCADGSDESSCVYPPCKDGYFRCNNGQCIRQEDACNMEADCLDGSDEGPGNNCSCHRGFQCYNNQCVKHKSVNDRFPDCPGVSQEDEFISENKEGFACESDVSYSFVEEFYCHEANSIRCNDGHKKCYPRHLACINDKNSIKALNVCRSFEHLQNCETYQCPSMFKCPRSYCIPLRQVCDGEKDCPKGEDEHDVICSNYTCPGKFRCKGEKQCLHPRDICNGVVNCMLSGDDETFCDMTTCPMNCTCTGYVINCTAGGYSDLPPMSGNIRSLVFRNNALVISNRTFKGYSMLIKLDVSANKLKFIPNNAFTQQSNLIELDISDNQIEIFYDKTFIGLSHLKVLRLGGNPLIEIEVGAFSDFVNVRALDLSSLYITTIYNNTFKGMEAVSSINISNNKLLSVQAGAFDGLPKLTFLDLSGNDDIVVDTNALASVTASKLISDNFGVCCLATSKVDDCSPKPDEFSSCYDLLKNSFLQVAVWIVGILSLTGNTAVFIVCVFMMYKKKSCTTGLYITNIALANFLMGICLIIIGSKDVLYRGNYAHYTKEWTSSFACKCTGFLAMVASEMSVTVLVLIATHRLLNSLPVNKIPNISPKFAMVMLLVCWLCWFILGIIPIADIRYFENFYGYNSVCLPFTLSQADFSGRGYINAIYVVFNSLAFLYICVVYVLRVWFLFRPQTIEIEDRGESGDMLFNGLSLILFSDLICWVPATCLGLANMSGASIAPEVSEWVTVFILTINSALNPVLFAVTNVTLCSKSKQGNYLRSSK